MCIRDSYVVDMGPKAGRLGGEVVFQGTPKQMLQTGTLTSKYLNGQMKIEIPGFFINTERQDDEKKIELYNKALFEASKLGSEVLEKIKNEIIDALPLASNMTIGRTVCLEGDPLELHLSLPLYDAEGGEDMCIRDRSMAWVPPSQRTAIIHAGGAVRKGADFALSLIHI